jgi:hypothetical protein
MLDGVQGCQRRRRNPTTAPGRRNHGRVPFSRHPVQSMVITGTGNWSEFKVIMLCIRTALTYLNSVGPFLANRQYNRHPGRGITTDHLSATISPESSRRYAPVESSSRSDSSSAHRSQMEVPSPMPDAPSKDSGKREWRSRVVVQANAVPRMSN